MALSQPRTIFGVHSFTPYSRTDGTYYGEMKVLKSSSLSLSASLISLTGGSSKFPWAIEDGEIKAELSLKFAEYPDFLFELFLGNAPTSYSAEAAGNVATLTNFKGTSVKNATTGIASATALAGSEANLKFGKVTVVAVSATTVDVYYSTDNDFGRGTDGAFTTDTLKIAAAQPITASAATNFAGYGFKLTGGSGTIGMTIGDSATFGVRPINSGGMSVLIGGDDQIFPEFGAIVMSQKRGTGEMLEIDVFRCKAAGMPLNFDQNAFSQGDVKIEVMNDSAMGGIMRINYNKSTT